jgi:hypothetical protein
MIESILYNKNCTPHYNCTFSSRAVNMNLMCDIYPVTQFLLMADIIIFYYFTSEIYTDLTAANEKQKISAEVF